MAVTLRFQSSGHVPGEGRPVMMRGGSLTVGRGPANDLVLPDPDRMLSKNHCVIEEQGGHVHVIDLSTNGTYLNYGKQPLGRTPTPLNHGDVLSVGGYELVVEISAQIPAFDDLLAPLAPEAPVSPGFAQRAPDPMELLDQAGPEGDFLDDLLGGAAPKGHAQIARPDAFDALLPPLGEENDPFAAPPPENPDLGGSFSSHAPAGFESFAAPQKQAGGMIPDDWDEDFLNPNPVPAAPFPAAPAPRAAPPVAPVMPPPLTAMPSASEPLPMAAVEVAAPPPVAAPVLPAAAPVPAAVPGEPAAARAFLAALGCEDLKIADADLPETMARMGRMMREMVTGLRTILMTRASIKQEFRIDQTMIGAGGNNPLKFSVSPEQALEALVKPRARGYLEAEAATKQALDDIKAHEVAMVTGMEAALKGVLAKLDPAVLAARIEGAGGGMGGLLKGKKARYWETYETMYAQISDQAENDFQELFSREFARAYKEQLDKLK